MKASVFISTSTFGEESDLPLKILEEAGIKYERNTFGRKLTPDETVAALRGKTGVIAGTELYTAAVLEQVKDLKVISRCGAGIDGIDLDELKKRNIALYRTADVHVNAVVELTVAAILALNRKLMVQIWNMKARTWQREMGRDFSGCTAGIIGLGKIGMGVARTINALGCRRILVFDPLFTGECPDFTEIVNDLHEIARQCDVITVHASLNHETRGLLSTTFFNAVKPDVKIINTARGELIDESSLHQFLKEHPQASAFLDVFAEEPYKGKLLDLPNVFATPHIGTFTRETRINMELEAAKNIINFFRQHG